jgi:hypothetical protein
VGVGIPAESDMQICGFEPAICDEIHALHRMRPQPSV